VRTTHGKEQKLMLGRTAALAALIAVAGCAGMESAGRTAARAPEPYASAPPPPATTAPAPAVAAPPPAVPPPVAAAPAPVADDPPATRASRGGNGDIVVPGARERQVEPPGGDPRSNAERMEDIRAWDRCVMRVQSAFDRDPMRPQLDSPEEYCRQSLGMADRTAIPESRLERRR
jgi:hypothetical protein